MALAFHGIVAGRRGAAGVVRQRETAEYYRREFLAEWSDSAGSFFSESELMAATADYQMTAPEDLANHTAWQQRTRTAAGIDWGVSQDANALALVGLIDPQFCGDHRWRLFVPWLRAEFNWSWAEFIDYVTKSCRSYDVFVAASERNGVGAWPTDDLASRLLPYGIFVSPVWTDIRRKQAGFSKMKMLLQSGRLVLPRLPELLKQLTSLEFEQSSAGTMNISVPERAGHDDLAMAVMQAISCADPRMIYDGEVPFGVTPPVPDRMVLTGGGVAIPRRPLPSPSRGWISSPKGAERTDGW